MKKITKTKQTLKTKNRIKTTPLSLALLAGCALFGCGQVSAAPVIDNNVVAEQNENLSSNIIDEGVVTGGAADVSEKEILTPTLQYLHDTEQTIEITNSDGTTTDTGVVYPESSYSIVSATIDDYMFTVQTVNSDNSLTTNYYNINIDTNKIGTSDSITWGTSAQTGDVTGSVEVNLPNSKTQTLYYGYTKPSDYTIGSRITSLSGNIDKQYFSGLKSTSSTKGGAISNASTTGYNIIGDFIGNYASSGGAIYNVGIISSIVGDFIGNYASSSDTHRGGAIYNVSTISSIVGDFIGNYASSSSSYAYGGAIYNYTRTISSIVGDFIGNYASSGGAIYNVGIISSIVGNFIGNYADSSSSNGAYGGAIYNGGKISSIVGDFIGNYASSSSSSAAAYGGAIYNGGTISSIVGNFIGNYADSSSSPNAAYGGAIYNVSTISTIVGDFIGNYADSSYVYSPSSSSSSSAAAYGGAIYNGGKISSIVGNFIGNYASLVFSAYGGAIHNIKANGIGLTNNKFLNNYAITSDDTAQGGAIYTSQDLTINANNGTTEFTGNYVSTDNGTTKNYEAIYVDSSSATLTLNAVNNGTILMNDYINGASGYKTVLTGDDTSVIKLHNNADIKNSNVTVSNNINIDTADNKLHNYNLLSLTSSKDAKWKIDLDLSKVVDGTKDYTVGKVADGITTTNLSSGYVTLNGLNFVSGSVADIIDKKLKIQIIQNNNSSSTLQLALDESLVDDEKVELGSAITSTINDLTNTMNYNDVVTQTDTTITTYGLLALATTNTTNDSIGITIKDIITNVNTYQVDTLAQLVKTEFKDSDGKILDKTFNVYDVDSDGNKTPDTYTLTTDLGTMTQGNLTINGVSGSSIDFNGKSAFELGDINGTTTLNLNDITLKNGKDNNVINVSYIDETVNLNNSNIEGNIVGDKDYSLNVTGDSSVSGNITKGTVDLKADDTKLTLNDSTVTEEIKSTGNNTTLVTNGTTNLQDKVTVTTLDNKGTTTVSKDLTTTYVMNSGNLTADDDFAVVTLTNNGTVNINKGIEYTKITSDTIGELNINNATLEQSGVIENQNVNLSNNATLNLGNLNNFTNNGVSLDNSTLNIGALGYNTLNLNTLSMTNNSTMNISSVNVDLATEKMGRITANNYGTIENSTVNVNALNIVNDANKITTNILFADKELASSVKYNGSKEYLTPIYKYDVSYKNNLGDDGYFQFVRGAGASSGSYDSFNPAATTPIAAVSGSKSVMNETFQYVYEHADSFTQLPSNDRFAKIHENEYALSTDYNMNLGSFNYEESNRGAWVRPFATFENVPLKNGPKLDSITYGTLIGYDGNFKSMRNGWHRLGTVYAGYNGAQISYSGNDTTLNGGLIGLTETFYKGNFWSAITLSTGATVGETSTMYGEDNYTSLMAGIGTKTGYNFEFKKGRYILQPIWNMSYTFVKTFDYTNAAGLRMDIDPNNSIQFHPMIRFIANYKNGWQPYVRIGMVWNTMDETNATANGVKLPETSVKPYFEYGLGVQKQWKERFTGYFQAMVRNGGRNGISLTAGFRWALGKDGNTTEKVQNNTTTKVAKQTKKNFLSKITHSENQETQQKTILKQLTTKDKKHISIYYN